MVLETVSDFPNHLCEYKLIFTSFEVQLGIIAASIPALRPGYIWLTSKVITLRNGYDTTTLLSSKSRDKGTAFEKGSSRTKDTISKRSNDWTEIQGEEIILPEYCQIRKTTEVAVERDVIRDSDGLERRLSDDRQGGA